MRRFLLLGIGAAAVTGLLAAGAFLALRPGGTAPFVVGRFTQNGVTVTLTVRDRSGPHATLEATFAPQRPGYHLYSIDLPQTGIDGVGRPLRVTVRSAVLSAGPVVTAERPVRLPLAGTSLVLPVYPDGPVTASLQVGATGSGTATVLVSYAACSRDNCLPPVTDHPVELRVGPSGVLS
ncbi:hypothetical protein [Streptacidiphilus jiangxiensis]|uniref:Disulphide bond corrector protein DsbC n=1 Tax=Streptacidiphilus jiangxiensis TaxID=235985 RepID=A0A1H7QL17_STRJI|nr:hypothetical protein [Streptacidiphilus jiangxiensis]SEL48489.1 hypothetical protein SAMN05414137_10979 [Streptacidiphilus jiangxiensis]